MFDKYTEMDRLVLERWTDVMGLIEAHKSVQQHIEDALDSVGEKLVRWVREQGFDGAMSARDAEFDLWRPSWFDKRKDQAKILLTLGGFCPLGYRKVDAKYPYLWVNIYPLDQFRVKPPERVAFSRALRAALGPDAASWEADGVDDTDRPLGRYLTQYDQVSRAQMLLEPAKLIEFAKLHLPSLIELAEPIDVELRRIAS